MSLIAERISKKELARIVESRTAPNYGYQVIGGMLVPIADSSINYIKKGFNINDVIYSIINLVLDKVRLAPWSVYEVVDDSSLKSYHSIMRNHNIGSEDLRLARNFRVKAIKPVKNAGRWDEILKYPNDNDTWQEFVANGAGYKMLTGNKFVWANRLDMGANKGQPASLELMPSQFMSIIASTGFPCKILGYELPLIGLTAAQQFSREEVLHEKYFNYDYQASGGHLMGMSPLRAGLKLTNRNNSALDSSTAMFQNGGPASIIYLDETGVDKKVAMGQMSALKQSLISEYSGNDNRGKVAASGYKVGAVNLGLSPVELDTIEAEKWDMRRFCNLLGGVPSQLMNDPENKTYNNQKEGEKALTSRCALAHLNAFRESLIRMGHEYWALKPNWIIDYDMTVFSELQDGMKETIDWLKPLAELTGLSPNRILDLMGLEKINDQYYDQPRVTPAMGQTLEEYSLSDVDKTLNEDD